MTDAPTLYQWHGLFDSEADALEARAIFARVGLTTAHEWSGDHISWLVSVSGEQDVIAQTLPQLAPLLRKMGFEGSEEGGFWR